jgi:hypothetical protein
MSRSIPVAAAVALALALGGCAGGLPGQFAAAPRPSANPAVVYHQFAQCVRDHGQPDFPDPTVDSQGQPHLPDSVTKPPDDVMNACMPILNRLPQSARPNSTHPDPAMMRRFAQCMRAHGIDDWPDPDSQGRFTFPPSLQGNLKTGPRWPQIQAAWDGPCKQYNALGHIEVNN